MMLRAPGRKRQNGDNKSGRTILIHRVRTVVHFVPQGGLAVLVSLLTRGNPFCRRHRLVAFTISLTRPKTLTLRFPPMIPSIGNLVFLFLFRTLVLHIVLCSNTPSSVYPLTLTVRVRMTICLFSPH